MPKFEEMPMPGEQPEKQKGEEVEKEAENEEVPEDIKLDVREDAKWLRAQERVRIEKEEIDLVEKYGTREEKWPAEEREKLRDKWKEFSEKTDEDFLKEDERKGKEEREAKRQKLLEKIQEHRKREEAAAIKVAQLERKGKGTEEYREASEEYDRLLQEGFRLEEELGRFGGY